MNLMLDFHLGAKDSRDGTHNQDSHGRRSGGFSNEYPKAKDKNAKIVGWVNSQGGKDSDAPKRQPVYDRPTGNDDYQKVFFSPTLDAFWDYWQDEGAPHEQVLNLMGNVSPEQWRGEKSLDNNRISWGHYRPSSKKMLLQGDAEDPPKEILRKVKKFYPKAKKLNWNERKHISLTGVDLTGPTYDALDFHLSVKDEREGSHNQASHRPDSAGRKERFASQGFDDATAEDKKRLAIPPAWKDVQVNRSPNARLMAVGTDAKGREQRIYSARHHEEQAALKFARIQALHEKLPKIDQRLSKDAKTNDDALSALLIRRMGLRPGSDTDTGAEKKAFGATNLKASHVNVKGDTVNLKFTGKKGVDLDLSIDDPELARLLKGRLKGKNPDDRLLDTSAPKLRAYMKDAAPGVKPKDFRTYLGTALAMDAINSMSTPKDKKDYRTKRRRVGEVVSQVLGNTPTVALASYIAPSVFGPWDRVVA